MYTYIHIKEYTCMYICTVYVWMYLLVCVDLEGFARNS